MSKTFSCTGWRLGWIIAPPAQTSPIRKVHDFLTVGAPAPLQTAAAVGFAFDADYYNHFALDYKRAARLHVRRAARSGLQVLVPEGAYYIFADFSELSDLDDVDVREVDDAGDRRRDGAGLELLLAKGRWARTSRASRSARSRRRSSTRRSGAVRASRATVRLEPVAR